MFCVCIHVECTHTAGMVFFSRHHKTQAGEVVLHRQHHALCVREHTNVMAGFEKHEHPAMQSSTQSKHINLFSWIRALAKRGGCKTMSGVPLKLITYVRSCAVSTKFHRGQMRRIHPLWLKTRSSDHMTRVDTPTPPGEGPTWWGRKVILSKRT